MIDEMEILRTKPALQNLLDHYAELAKDDRETWHDRVMELEGASTTELVRLYGELLAFGWLEQNTGLTPVLHPERAAACYRVTSQGLRARKEAEREAVLS